MVAGLLFSLVPLGNEARGAFFGTNGYVAYTCGSDVCFVVPGGSAVTAISDASDPVWSPDGSKVAFVTSAGAVDVQQVVSGALSGSPVQVAAPPASQPTWSSSGLRIAYASSTSGDIFVANADGSGGATAVLATSGELEMDPAWSPDGTTMAFTRSVSGHDQIFTVALGNTGVASGMPVQRTSVSTGDVRHPSWSPDGDTIVYSSTQDGLGAPLLYTMTSGGLNQTRLGPASGIPGDTPAFSPDRTKIVFAVPSDASTGTPGNLDTIASDGSGTPATVDSGTSNADPDWQPTSSGGGSGPPGNTTYPTIVLPTGATAPGVGQRVAATVGSWTGSLPIAYTFQWRKCEPADPLNGDCYTIPGATSSLLSITPDLYKWRLRILVTAKNDLGSARQLSEASAVVTATAPDMSRTPPIVGNNFVGQTLSVTSGSWTGSTPLTFAYEWRRCDPYGTLSSCLAIPGATSTTYMPTTDDIGTAIRVYITGTNVAGSAVGITNHTFPIVDRPHFAPSSQVGPQISGTAELGGQLIASGGTFGGDEPISTTLQWQRCDATGAACRDIARATREAYTPTAADLGSTLRVAVTATNAYGSLVAPSQPSDPVRGMPPHHRGQRIVGTNKSEYLAGGGFDDVIFGNGGNDTLVGGNGYDTIYGGPGRDILIGGAGSDRLDGGPGSDTIFAQDGERDVVDCGSGHDRAVVDSIDVVRGCEVVEQVPPGGGSAGTASGASGSG